MSFLLLAAGVDLANANVKAKAARAIDDAED
jgi:hypothetical protein